MPEEPKVVRAVAIIATTHNLQSRGIQISRDALQDIVDQFQPGLPIFVEHGVDPVGRALRQELRPRDDGEWEVYAEVELDVPPGETAESVIERLKPHWSIAITERGDDAPESPVVTIGIDSLAFTDEDLRQGRAALAQLPVSTYVTWLHQLAFEPNPAIVLSLVQHALSALPPEVQSKLIDTVQELFVKLIFRKPGSQKTKGPVVVRVRGADLRIDVRVPPDGDPEVVKTVFDGIRATLAAGRAPRHSVKARRRGGGRPRTRGKSVS